MLLGLVKPPPIPRPAVHSRTRRAHKLRAHPSPSGSKLRSAPDMPRKYVLQCNYCKYCTPCQRYGDDLSQSRLERHEKTHHSCRFCGWWPSNGYGRQHWAVSLCRQRARHRLKSASTATTSRRRSRDTSACASMCLERTSSRAVYADGKPQPSRNGNVRCQHTRPAASSACRRRSCSWQSMHG